MPLDENTQSSFVMRLAILEEKVRALERCDASKHATGGIYDRLDKLERRQGVPPRPPAPQESATDYHRDMAIQYRKDLNSALERIAELAAFAEFLDKRSRTCSCGRRMLAELRRTPVSREEGGPSAE